ncbi:MAG: hypothetical protein PHC29_08640 [Candidatus Omnitrophica bacterium]|nr:hypothetical protein [Candidatus Omnitrophota bacterium]
MSIINEALKKTEQYIQENEVRNRPQNHGLENHNLPAKLISTPAPLLIYILIILAGILLSKFIFSLLSRPESRSLVSTHNQQQNYEEKTTKLTTPTPATLPISPITPLANNKSTEPDFVLNGIFFSDNDGYALVNNQIVRENDSVDGAKITKITTNTVELDKDGKLISLASHR